MRDDRLQLEEKLEGVAGNLRVTATSNRDGTAFIARSALLVLICENPVLVLQVKH